MSKKIVLAVLAVLMFASIAVGQQWWWYNKTVWYIPANPAQQAWDLDVIVRPNIPARVVYVELFQNFSQRPIWTWRWGWCRLLHWFNPQPAPLPAGGITHIGAGGNPAGGRIVFMYFTDQFGNRIPRSICWNLSSNIVYFSPSPQSLGAAGQVKFYLNNEIEPMDEEGNPSVEPWDAKRAATAIDVRYAVFNKPVPLDMLNDENAELSELLKPLGDASDGSVDVVVEPGDLVEFTVPEPVSPGQYVVFRWDNYAPAVEGSDSTRARDWVEYLVEGGSLSSVKEKEPVEQANLLINPLSLSPEIHYQVPQASRVTLAVYSVAGERVVVLVDEEKVAGSYTVRWDTSNIPAGVYFCRLLVDGNPTTEKMVHVK